jgi:Outer membrane lipoprotein-sorting protein
VKNFSVITAVILFAANGAMAETTNDFSDAEIQGRQLVQKILEQTPATNSIQTGVLKIRDDKGKTSAIPIKFETIVTTTNWSSIYELSPADIVSNTWTPIRLVVLHDSSNSNQYHLTISSGGNPERQWTKDRSDIVAILPFAGDFSVADLGLEFFHWPAQKVLKKEVHRSRGCAVLESTNPNLAFSNSVPPIRYSRVVSWIDEESLGIVEANAYDVNGKKLKNFYPKNLEKVNGQYQVQSMIMDNLQTGSRTRLEFDLKK